MRPPRIARKAKSGLIAALIGAIAGVLVTKAYYGPSKSFVILYDHQDGMAVQCQVKEIGQ